MPKGTYRFILLAMLLFVNLLTRAQTVDSSINGIQHDSVVKIIPLAKDDFNDPVFGQSEDSIVYNAGMKQIHLYRDAQIKYQDIVVDASYILYEQDSSIMKAAPLEWEKDSVDKHLLTKGEEKTKFKTKK